MTMTDDQALKELVKAWKEGRIILRDPQVAAPIEEPKPQPKKAVVERGITATDEEILTAVRKKYPSFELLKVSTGTIYGKDRDCPCTQYGTVDIELYAQLLFSAFPDCRCVSVNGSTFPRSWLSSYFK